MNYSEFKQEIEGFLSEVNVRRQEVSSKNFISKIQVGKSLFDYARNYFFDSFQLVYSVSSIRLDAIFHLGSKNELINASNIDNIRMLYNAVKYEIIANKYMYENLSLDEFYYVYWGYLVRLSKNYNWTMTINRIEPFTDENGYQNKREVIDYLEWMNNEYTNILSSFYIEHTYKTIFVENNHDVKDINGEIKTIQIKKSEYNTMKRLSKEQIVNLLERFEEKPTVRQLADLHNNEDKENYVSKELMRSYIKSYGLEDRIKTCNHTEKFLNK